jgi:hypothetical protein
MGGTFYSVSNRAASGRTKMYKTASINDTFTQNKKRAIHESMDPSKIDIREARDSDNHPNSVPIILGLDLTGSMGHVPHQLIKDGLPDLISGLIQNGVPDPALLFVGVGDHETDRAPLQVGQFESGDEELDMWLTRTYLEGGGGGNGGESYHLAWYFAAHHTVHDAWEKRKKKGFLFTIGDEPCLKNLPASAIKEIMGSGQANYSTVELLAAAREHYHVYHIHLNHRRWSTERDLAGWKELMGQDVLEVSDHNEIANLIKDIVVKNSDQSVSTASKPTKPKVESITDNSEPEIL